jgi:hypothetical protein
MRPKSKLRQSALNRRPPQKFAVAWARKYHVVTTKSL